MGGKRKARAHAAMGRDKAGLAVNPEICQQMTVPSPLCSHPKVALNSLLVPKNQEGGSAHLRIFIIFVPLHTFRPDNLLCLAGSYHMCLWFEVTL